MSSSSSRTKCCCSCLTLLLLTCFSTVSATRSASLLVSDGGVNEQRLDNNVGPRIVLPTDNIANSSMILLSLEEENDQGIEEECEENYGFLPCSKTAPTNLFLIIVYGYLIFVAATCLSEGGDLLSEILGVGIVGGFFLPLLGSLPDALLILVSGLSGSIITAQDKLSVGMGLLAGATVVRLTVIWGTCVVAGKHNLEKSDVAVDEIDTNGCHLLDSGVSTDIWTCYSTRIMVISVLPFLVVQFPQVFSSPTTTKYSMLIACITSSLMLISYGLYQVLQPRIQERRLQYVKHKRVLTGFLKHLKKHAFGKLCNPDGSLDDDVIEKLFKRIDMDGSNHLCKGELRGFIIGIQFEGMSMAEDDIVEKVLKEFDTERRDGIIDLEEFKTGITKLLKQIKGHNAYEDEDDDVKERLDKYDEEAKMEHLLLGEEEAGEEVEKDLKTIMKAVYFLVVGTVILAIFAEPLVDAFHHFSGATGIPMFFLSFIALPIVTNSGEAKSAVLYASKKTKKSASLTLSEIHGMVTVNNLLCLSVFLALVYLRGLAWDFSSEVLITFLVCIIMGGLGSCRTTFPLWTAALAFLLYPISLVVVYVLDYVFGWS